MSNVIYVVRPPETQSPGITQVIEEARSVLNDEEAWADWDFQNLACNANKNFKVNDFYSVIMRNPGPVIVLERPVERSVQQLQTKLFAKSSVLVSNEYDTETFFSLAMQAKEAFESGQPQIPRKYAAGLLLIKKLYDNKYWGGRDKNYIWRDDVPKGRGIDYTVIPKAVIFEALSDLIEKQFVSLKHGKQTKKGNKYCLNREKRSAIEKVLEDGAFRSAASIEKVFLRDKNRVNRDVLKWESPEQVAYYTCGEIGELFKLLIEHPDTIANLNIEISTVVWLVKATDGRCKVTIGESNLNDSANEILWVAVSNVELPTGGMKFRDDWNAMSLVVAALKGYRQS